MTTTARLLTDEEVKVVSEIWDTLALLHCSTAPNDIKKIVLDEAGDYKSPAALRAILRDLKETYRGR